MLNICEKCGSYRADKTIDPSGPYAICPECGHRHIFAYNPLWIVSGASGSGKSSVCRNLTGQLDRVVLLDSDILWREAFNTPENNYADFFETWMRMCKNIAQSGRPVVLFGVGVGVPENLENCIERRYFSTIHYLALVCANEVLTQRLQARPAWRSVNSAGFIEEQKRFNQWFLHYNRNGLEPVIRLLDTSLRSLEETAQAISSWIDQNLAI
jgi:predicted kinase/DNA-directed RNA polymerase subunit RPC12/RpoP